MKVGTKIASTTAPIIASLVTGNPLPVVLSLPNNTKEIETTIKNVSDTVKGIKDDYLKNEEIVSDSVVNNVRNFKTEFEKNS